MRSSLVKQLAIYCSLLLVKSSGSKDENTDIVMFSVYFWAKIWVNLQALCKSSYENIEDYTRFKSYGEIKGDGLICAMQRELKKKDIKLPTNTIESEYQELPSIACEVERSFVKLLTAKFWNLKVLRDGKPATYDTSLYQGDNKEFLCLHILSKRKDEFLLYLCNSILYEFESAGASNEVLSSIKKNLYDFINSTIDAINVLKRSTANKKSDYEILLEELNGLFKSSVSSTIFMIDCYYQAFLYVELNKSKGKNALSNEALKRYTDLYLYINALYKILFIIHHVPGIIDTIFGLNSGIENNRCFYEFIGKFKNTSPELFNKLSSITSTADITVGFVNDMNKRFTGYMINGTKSLTNEAILHDSMLDELCANLLFSIYEHK